MLRQTSRVSSSHQNNEKNYMNICLEMNGFWVELRDYMQQQIPLNYLIFYYSWHNTFTIQAPNVIIVELQILKTSSTWISARMDTSDHWLSHHFRGSGAVAKGLPDIKMRWWIVPPFSLGAEYTTLFKFPTDKNLKDWYQEVVRMYVENRLQTYTDVKFCPCFGVGDSPEVFSAY